VIDIPGGREKSLGLAQRDLAPDHPPALREEHEHTNVGHFPASEMSLPSQIVVDSYRPI